MNYASLTDLVLRWANRSEIEPAIPGFLTLVDAELKRRLSEAGIAGGEGRDTATLSAGDEYSTAPPDLGRVIRMVRTVDGEPVEAVSASALAAARAAAPDARGAPVLFALAAGGFRFHPMPDADVEVELTYQRRHPALTASNPSNWISLRHPDVYVTGVMERASHYLADDAAAARWAPLFERAVGGLVRAERERRGSPRASGYRADVPLGRG